VISSKTRLMKISAGNKDNSSKVTKMRKQNVETTATELRVIVNKT
jgi:hypothetical protein